MFSLLFASAYTRFVELGTSDVCLCWVLLPTSRDPVNAKQKHDKNERYETYDAIISRVNAGIGWWNNCKSLVGKLRALWSDVVSIGNCRTWASMVECMEEKHLCVGGVDRNAKLNNVAFAIEAHTKSIAAFFVNEKFYFRAAAWCALSWHSIN